MKNLFLVLSFFALSTAISAQYSTPGTGVHWNMDSLIVHSNDVVFEMGPDYAIFENLTISENDTLTINGDFFIGISSTALLIVAGTINTAGLSGLIFSSLDTSNPYQGIRIEETGEAYFYNTLFSYGGGIKCISENVSFNFCEVIFQTNLATNSAAIEFFSGSPELTNSTISDNVGAAISSPANIDCAPQIIGCNIERNNSENSNRPQINLGPSGANETTIIQDCIIIGSIDHDQAGGIAASTLFGSVNNIWIQGNDISSNRYGIAILGNEANATILDNVITENNTQGDPLLGGSGINLNGNESSFAKIGNNYISGNLWGITVQGSFQVDMGNPDILADSPGNNVFSYNANGGEIYALYNNTAEPILAVNNCWIDGQLSTAAEIEDVIFHQTDDASLGFVDYSSYQCGTVGVSEEEQSPFSLYPNPAEDVLYLTMKELIQIKSIQVIDSKGRIISEDFLIGNATYQIPTHALASGIYLLRVVLERGIYEQRIQVN